MHHFAPPCTISGVLPMGTPRGAHRRAPKRIISAICARPIAASQAVCAALLRDPATRDEQLGNRMPLDRGVEHLRGADRICRAGQRQRVEPGRFDVAPLARSEKLPGLDGIAARQREGAAGALLRRP